MRIGIDAHVLGKDKGGVERYVQKLVELLPLAAPQHEYVVFVTKDAYRNYPLVRHDNVSYIPLIFDNILIQRLFLMPVMVMKHRLTALQVQRLSSWIPSSCSLVLTIHDITPIRYPGDYGGLTNWLVKKLTGGSIKRATKVVTPTMAVAAQLDDWFAEIAIQSMPFYNGVDRQIFYPRANEESRNIAYCTYGLKQPYAFVSGALESRKNLEVIYRALAQSDPDLALVITGGVRDRQYQSMLKMLAEREGVSDRIFHLGYVSEPELVELYQCAELFIASSKDEGFNIPPLEAMACGIPVICSDIPVHRELYSGSCLFFPPDDVTGLAQAIRRLREDSDVRRGVIEGSGKSLDTLNWEAMAQRMANCYASLEKLE